MLQNNYNQNVKKCMDYEVEVNPRVI